MFSIETNPDMNRKRIIHLFLESLLGSFTGHPVESEALHKDWDAMGCNKKVAQMGGFRFHAGTMV